MQIDKDNLKLDESVGTFRWNNDMTLLNAPTWSPSMRAILLQSEEGWKAYVEPRFEHAAIGNEIKVEPH